MSLSVIVNEWVWNIEVKCIAFPFLSCRRMSLSIPLNGRVRIIKIKYIVYVVFIYRFSQIIFDEILNLLIINKCRLRLYIRIGG